MKRLKDKLSSVEAKQTVSSSNGANPNTEPVDVADGKDEAPTDEIPKPYLPLPIAGAAAQPVKTLHERDSDMDDLSKVHFFA